jgi:zinc protease
VYDKRLARDVGASYELTSIDPGLFLVYAQPLPGKAAKLLEQELLSQLANMESKPIGEHELAKAKNGLEARFVRGQDSLFYQALLLGQYEAAADWRLIDTYLPSIRAVTSADLQRVASTYLTSSNRTVGTLEPLPIPLGKQGPVEGLPHAAVR